MAAYKEPDHSIGESAWPGKQPPTRQLSLFDTSFKQSQPEQRRIDLTPSPVQTRIVQTKLTKFLGALATTSAALTGYPCSSDDDESVDGEIPLVNVV